MKLVVFLGITIAVVFGYDEYGGGRGYQYGGGGRGRSPPRRPPPRPRPPPPRPPPPPPPAAPRCPSGWLQFNRPQGRWCVQVVHANIDYYHAQIQCASMGGTLSGVQTQAERIAIANEGRRIQRAFGIGDGSIWLGARRKASCPRKNSCSAENTFQWVDGFTTGTAGIHFSPGQPDGLLSGQTAQDCIQQFIYPWADTSPTWPGIPHGAFDDQFCSWTIGPVNRFFACGKRA